MKNKKLSPQAVVSIDKSRQWDKELLEKVTDNGFVKPLTKATGSKKRADASDEMDISTAIKDIIRKNYPKEEVESEYERIMNFIGQDEDRIYFVLVKKEIINITAPSRIYAIGTPESEIWMYYMYCDDVNAYVIQVREVDETGKVFGSVKRLSYPKFMEVT